ncbi:Rad4-domain-containing protein [Phlegmacium glaucopus]|nr:Rad4-domain-containing protein [Phlegmacium glaucopus]
MEEINSNAVDSDDDLDWEEVQVPEHQHHLEITLQTHPKLDKTTNKKKGIPHAERLLRIDCHKIHTVALIVNAHVRNKWINDPLLHARLISLTPLHLQTAFSVIHRSRIPNHNQRGRMFEAAMKDLTEWWASSFFEVLPDGHIRSRTFDEVRRGLEVRGLHLKDENNPDAIIDIDTLQDMLDDEIEPIRSPNSLMKHALMRNGSRDISAQLFTALCRGLGIPARLVVSLQSVPWQTGVGKPKPAYERKSKGKGKEKAMEVKGDDEASNSNSMMDSDIQSGFSNGRGRRLDGGPVKSDKAKGKEKAKPAIKLRKTKSRGQILGGPSYLGMSRITSPDPLITPPVFWTEVFSRPDTRWFPIDPIRGHINDRKVFDPTSSNINANASIQRHQYFANNNRSTGTKVENRMVYVLAFEEDGYARDVTRRYAREYSTKVAKVQGGSSALNIGGGGKGRQAWWSSVMNAIHRPFRLHRDDLEDQELEAAQLMEGMPTTMGGFKDHPIYVLTRHLKQTETIHPPPPATSELGKFRGEPVYPRSSVVSLKTAENWMRNTGRTVIAGEQPMKMVKIRAGTVNRMRELEVLKDELRVAGQDGPNGQGEGSSSATGEIMQGLYAYSQTEPYVPDPVVDGKVPKNTFGNIDLYVPSMLPKGAAHIPFKGVAKIARKLGFDYAEAVTGFEFKKRRAFPIIEGVVVAAENEATLLEAFWEAEREAEEKARIKREDRVIKNWKRLIHGLQIRQRLQEQYGHKPREKKPPREAGDDSNDNEDESKEASPHVGPGGFLAGADRVVQAFHLPKNTRVTLSYTSSPVREIPKLADELEEPATSDAPADFIASDFVMMDIDSDREEVVVGLQSEQAQAHRHHYIPKTMQEMAEEHAARRQQQLGSSDAEDIANDSEDKKIASPQAPLGARPTRKSKNQATVKIALLSEASTPNNLSSNRSTKSKTNRKSSTTPNSKRKRKSSRKKVEEESDSADLSLADEGDEEDDESSTRKRARVRAAAKAKPTPVAVAPSTRTLRPRISKTTAQIEEDEDD